MAQGRYPGANNDGEPPSNSPDSSSIATGRAALILGLALIIGLVALQSLDDEPAELDNSSISSPRSTTTTAVKETTTTTAALRAPDQVKVLVLNGAGVAGAGKRVSDQIQTAKFSMLEPDNTTALVDVTVVYFRPGFNGEAAAVAKAAGLNANTVKPLPAEAPLPTTDDVANANTIVIVGKDRK